MRIGYQGDEKGDNPGKNHSEYRYSAECKCHMPLFLLLGICLFDDCPSCPDKNNAANDARCKI